MTTMSAFVSYQSSFNTALAKFIADPGTEADAAKAAQRWNVLSKFEINFNHHTKVGRAAGSCISRSCAEIRLRFAVTFGRCHLVSIGHPDARASY